jgi:penicillin-binding protein 1A
MAGKRKKNKKEKDTTKKLKKANKKTQIAKENEKKIKKDKKVKFKDKHPKLSLAIKIIILLVLLTAVIGTGIVIGIIYGAFGEEFEITVEELAQPTSNSIIYDVEGNVIAELNGDENRKNITLQDMSPYLAKAYVSIEDERFKEHSGVDILRTGKAIVTYIFNGGSSSFGGSTITQQLVKNITNDKEDTGVAGMFRKLKEWAKAYQVETLITKDQILELYLNTIFVGGNNNCGVETGAHYYFNKSAHDLTLVECAYMAGINSAPNAYNPYGENGYGVNEKKTNKINNKTKTVLNKMLELGAITQEEHNAGIQEINEKGIIFTKGEKTTNYSYHTDALINEVIADLMVEKGLSKAAAQNYIETQGLHIYSTETPGIQNKVQESMQNAKKINSKKNKDENGNPIHTQAAIVVIDHKTGYVLGCVGGLGEKTAGGLNRATQSRRQPGSTIKPIADVIPGLEEKKITAATIYEDIVTDFYVSGWTPKNYGHRCFGLMTVRHAVEISQNIPFIKIMKELTPQKGIDYLEKMGITQLDRNKDGLAAISIGGLTNGISPLEMAAAYATIANDGIYIEPTFYTKVEDSNHNVILTSKQESRRAFSEATAYLTKDILTEPVTGASGTARKCAIKGIDVAAKTGTSNEDIDRWLCGFTNYYTASVWYGYDEPETIIQSGTSPATLIWADAMSKIHSGLANSRFKQPSGIVSATICKETGKLASDKCTDKYVEIFEKGTIPQSCDGHIGHTICGESKLLANEYCKETETIYEKYVPEKETLGLWVAKEKVEETKIPETYCTIHKKPEEQKKPEETIKPENPDENEETNTKPNDKENNTTNSNTTGNTTGNTTSNTTGNNTTGNNTTGNNTTGNNTTGNNTESNTTINTN